MLEQVKPGKKNGVELVHQHIKMEAPVTEQSYQAVHVDLPAVWSKQNWSVVYDEELTRVPKSTYDACRITPLVIKTDSGRELEISHTVSTRDEDTSRGVMIYFHGGGYHVGSPRSHEALIGWLAYATEMDIVAPAYRMYPEADCTDWLEDAIATYKWVTNECKVDPSKVVFSGDSAGGNLTVVTVLAIIKHNEAIKNGLSKDIPLPMPACAVGLSPWLDPLAEGASYVDNHRLDWMLGGPFSVCSAPDNLFVLKKEDREPAKKDASLRDSLMKDPLVSPSHAPPEWLNQLCPMLIHVSSTELLYSDSVTFYNRARFAKCKEIILKEWPNMPHVWHTFAHILPEGVDAIQDVATYIHSRLTAPAVPALLRQRLQQVSLTGNTRSSL
eukprot:Clim_evm10s143 gene=Clim_evmTU10s143